MFYIGLDIGGTKCAASLGKIVLGTEIPEIIKKEQFLTADLSPKMVLERFSEFITGSINMYEIVGIGISCGGPLDGRLGIIKSPPSLPLWDNVNIVEYFECKFGINLIHNKTFLYFFNSAQHFIRRYFKSICFGQPRIN